MSHPAFLRFRYGSWLLYSVVGEFERGWPPLAPPFSQTVSIETVKMVKALPAAVEEVVT